MRKFVKTALQAFKKFPRKRNNVPYYEDSIPYHLLPKIIGAFAQAEAGDIEGADNILAELNKKDRDYAYIDLSHTLARLGDIDGAAHAIEKYKGALSESLNASYRDNFLKPKARNATAECYNGLLGSEVTGTSIIEFDCSRPPFSNFLWRGEIKANIKRAIAGKSFSSATRNFDASMTYVFDGANIKESQATKIQSALQKLYPGRVSISLPPKNKWQALVTALDGRSNDVRREPWVERGSFGYIAPDNLRLFIRLLKKHTDEKGAGHWSNGRAIDEMLSAVTQISRTLAKIRYLAKYGKVAKFE